MPTVGNLNVVVHRTVRVPEGRTPANLPPSLGKANFYRVDKYRETCPSTFEDDGVFVGLYDKEAIWLAFSASAPVAVAIGAGGTNAITGTPLELCLKEGSYLAVPPQPWLDGWKGEDGTIYQFVSARFEAGKGNTVAEQLIGEESKSGGIGLAVFDSKEPVVAKQRPVEVGNYEMTGSEPALTFGGATKGMSSGSVRGMSSAPVKEMGLGKGGAIAQKIYPDPYGIDVWQNEPSATMAIYLVDAVSFSEITGEELSPAPQSSDNYKGNYFHLEDKEEVDLPGTEVFAGLNSVFAAVE
jgi:hypothetical protein